MRKSLIPVAVLLAAALTLGGCGEKASNIGRDTGGEASSSVAETTVDGTAGDGVTAREAAGDAAAAGNEAAGDSHASGELATRTAPEAPTDYVTEEMLAEATKFANVNFARLENVMRRAEAGEDITVGVIGGSITQGSSASSTEKSYAAIMRNWWQETFPDSEITYVNAGIGGTDSYLGVHRMGPDLLDHEPDFVIVEFSVNDSTDSLHKTSYENLVRRILLQDNDPAVLLLYMTMEDGTSAQSNDALVGFYYNLPQISYHDTIMARIQAGDLTWKEISPDNIHPNDYGHAICGELIWKYLSQVYEGLGEEEGEYTVPATAQTREAYMNAQILDRNTLSADAMEGFAEDSVSWVEFENGWSCENGGSITFTVEAKSIGVLYYKSTSGTYGTADVSVDGEPKGALVGDFPGGWGNYGTADSVFSEKETGVHTIRIEVPEGKCFDILGILISE